MSHDLNINTPIPVSLLAALILVLLFPHLPLHCRSLSTLKCIRGASLWNWYTVEQPRNPLGLMYHKVSQAFKKHYIRWRIEFDFAKVAFTLAYNSLTKLVLCWLQFLLWSYHSDACLAFSSSAWHHISCPLYSPLRVACWIRNSPFLAYKASSLCHSWHYAPIRAMLHKCLLKMLQSQANWALTQCHQGLAT